MGEENRWPRIRLLAAAAVSGCCCDRGRGGSLAAKFTVTLLGALSDFAALRQGVKMSLTINQ